MKSFFWHFVHNAVAHPLIILPFDWTETFHDYTAVKAYGQTH